jgi:hypothetical protein
MISNSDLCAQKVGNTGWENCGIDIERIKSILIMPRSLSFDADDIASDAAFIAALQAATVADKSGRLYPLMDRVVALTNNTAEPGQDTAGYGNLMGVQFGKHNFQMRIDNNGLHLFQQLFKFNNNKGLSFAFIDGNGKFFARKYSTGCKGMPGQIIVNQAMPAVDATVMVQNLSIMLDEEDAIMNDAKLFVFPFGSDYVLSDYIHGIHDVVLSGTATTAKATITAMLPANFVDFVALYATELAEITAWSVTAQATGAAVTLTSATVSGSTVTLTPTAPLSAGASYLVSLVSPSDLLDLTAPIGSATTGGYESNVLIVTVPGA